MATMVQIPEGITASDGGSPRWTKVLEIDQKSGQPTNWAVLDWRLARQALPRGSSPLMAFGGLVVEGQNFSADEVEKFIIFCNQDRTSICVFENEHIR